MKKSLVLLVATVLSSQAAVVQFDLSPAGTDAAAGLSPLNEVPAVTNSTGSGNAVSGGILFDTTSMVMQVAIGYGAAPGFTDLTGVPTALGINGPASTGQVAGVIVDLMPYNFPAANPTNGGIIFGNLAFPTNSVSNLLAGFTYVNIHTTLNPDGEIRGQLIPVINEAPTVTCPPAATVECGTNAELTAVLSDPNGDALNVVWSVNGTPVQTNAVPASNPPIAANVSLSISLPLGTNVVTVAATDTATNTASCTTQIIVVDTIPPVIDNASATPNNLWPPNHKMVRVNVRAHVTDLCGPTTWKIIRVTSNEPVNDRGDGNTSPDWQIISDHSVLLRAERSGRGHGRVYTITIQATDAAGNESATKNLTVTVPKSQGRRK